MSGAEPCVVRAQSRQTDWSEGSARTQLCGRVESQLTLNCLGINPFLAQEAPKRVGGDRLNRLDDWSEEKTLHRTPALPAKHVQRVCRSGRSRGGGPGREKSSPEVDGKRPRKAGGGQVPDLLRPNRIASDCEFEDKCLLHEVGV
ncbi:hypothetical protein THAOC_23706 [Thalassiosira oceanica]|uniref:Uncharacterized protein n=1 Tax=Thalassiosira oceanica TaxID=159749 RepID=K0RRG7_THAOC|nr:hypothetical protein THAOC_23706 [Thalassiosira oceanica]|eukprot:EJK56408.1 hypothetical protein THAOC_23706 [Thalassiosira oceanica]